MNSPTHKYSIRSFSKNVIAGAVKLDCVWSLLNASVIPVVNHAKWARQNRSQIGLIPLAVQERMGDLIVRHGPFAGLQYPWLDPSVASLFAKLLGSYERELHPVVDVICNAGYSEVVNVGCAEGYYAVGLASRIGSARVFAFDTNKPAVQKCQQLAARNNVADRLITGGFCDEDTIAQMQFSRKALIVSDCEGYELRLFSPRTVEKLAKHDVLVEVHDFVDVTISGTLRERFSQTHHLQITESVDDVRKPYQYEYPELEGYSIAQRHLLLAEGRPAAMQWFYFTSKSNPA